MILDFLKFLYHNSYIQLALYLLPFGVLLALVEFDKAKKIFEISMQLSLVFAGIGAIQTIFLFFNKKLMVYKDLTKLLLVTKKIEAELESYGGYGKGMFEKAKSIEAYLREGMLDDILLIADMRNKAMHGNPYIQNASEVLSKAKKIHKQLVSMSSLSYKLKYYSAHFIMFTILYIAAKVIYMHFHLGAAFLSLVLGYMINKLVMNAFGYGGYIVLVCCGVLGALAMIFYKYQNFSIIVEFLYHAF